MLIVDFNQVMISAFMQSIGGHTNTKIEPDLVRHMVLNSIRANRVKFKNKFGEMIIACDDRENWRKKVYPYYKANRKADRDKSEINWNALFDVMATIRAELKENFPYRVIHVNMAEADDIIATLVMKLGPHEEILILSGDKDFRQLHTNDNIFQYDPTNKRWIEENDPMLYLKEHIIRGDRGDGISNFLTDADVFITPGKRSKSIFEKKLPLWLTQAPEDFCPDEAALRKYRLNEQVIDLRNVPEEIQDEVMSSYAEQAGKINSSEKLRQYFMHHRLKLLSSDIGDF